MTRINSKCKFCGGTGEGLVYGMKVKCEPCKRRGEPTPKGHSRYHRGSRRFYKDAIEFVDEYNRVMPKEPDNE